MTKRQDITYRVNDRDEIVFVNEEWDRFAVANAGESVMSSSVLHNSLWDFIVDSTSCELYWQILKRTRDNGSVGFTFRCDSPSCRRLLAMYVNRVADGNIEFRTHTLVEVNRQPVVFPETNSAEAEGMLSVCGWCKKVCVDESWLEVEDAIAQLQLFHRSLMPTINHVICERCFQEMTETLADL